MGSVGSLPRRFPLFNFFYLLVSSVSDFCPDTERGQWWTLFFFFKVHLFSHTVGRERCCKQVTLACAHSVSAPLGLPLLAAHTAQALRCSNGNCLRPALGCMHRPGLSRFRFSSWVAFRDADSVGPAFCALPWTE